MKRGNKILFSRRYNTGFHDGEYSLPAGHLEGNETLISAMVREAEEEIGIKLKPENLKLAHVLYRKEPNEERINFFFIAENWGGKPKIMEPHKCDDLKWFEPETFLQMLFLIFKQAIDNISKEFSIVNMVGN